MHAKFRQQQKPTDKKQEGIYPQTQRSIMPHGSRGKRKSDDNNTGECKDCDLVRVTYIRDLEPEDIPHGRSPSFPGEETNMLLWLAISLDSSQAGPQSI